MTKEEKRCERCKQYAKLQEPFHYEKLRYPEGVTVYGFCTKDIGRLQSFYPVYLPDGGVCQAFKQKGRALKEESPCDGQLTMEVTDNA